MKDKKLPPKAITALVFGILSVFPYVFLPILALNAFVAQDIIASAWPGGSSVGAAMIFIPNFIFAAISLCLASRSDDVINQNPELYRGTRMLKAARVTAYIGAFLSFAAIVLIWLAVKKII